jgi:hypothetical protein
VDHEPEEMVMLFIVPEAPEVEPVRVEPSVKIAVPDVKFSFWSCVVLRTWQVCFIEKLRAFNVHTFRTDSSGNNYESFRWSMHVLLQEQFCLCFVVLNVLVN